MKEISFGSNDTYPGSIAGLLSKNTFIEMKAGGIYSLKELCKKYTKINEV